MARRGNPNIRNIPHKGRKSKDSELFYFIINDTIRVTKDYYQYIIVKKNVSKETGKAYELGVRYYNSLENLAKIGLPEFGVTQIDIDTFMKKTKGVSQIFVNGRMKVAVPDDIQYDKRDVIIEGEGGDKKGEVKAI